MNFYNYLVGVVEDLKKTWEESRPYVEPEVEKEVELTYNGNKLKKDVIEFYTEKLETSITKTDVDNYKKRLELTDKVPPAAWNKMAGSGISVSTRALTDAVWFISFWNGNVDDLVI
jgi:hypothetical protein